MKKKKLYTALIQAEVLYAVEAANADEAEDIALKYFDNYLPYDEVTKISVKRSLKRLDKLSPM